MITLLHTSKTMRVLPNGISNLTPPILIDKARTLAHYMQKLDSKQIANVMRVSNKLAGEVVEKYHLWTDDLTQSSAAIDSFIGDIYSGMQAGSLSEEDRKYANEHLYILSGLYGILRPLDGIVPYRLEMSYKLPDRPYTSLYSFWGDSVARTIPTDTTIVNLAAVEYSRLVAPFVEESRIVTPRFLTINEKTGEPVFVVVHAKIARGAFARWMIVNRVNTVHAFSEFSEIGYRYDASLSSSREPVFVCSEFGGKGLSVRLDNRH